jgi:spore coat protein U-like protein
MTPTRSPALATAPSKYNYAVRFLALKQAVGGNYTDTVTVTAAYN